MRKIVAIVPIKLNNERLPGKNTKMLGDKPLLAYCLDTLLTVSEISAIYIYCSDIGIRQYLPEGVSFLKRLQALDLPTANFTQIFDVFMREIDADIYVYAHATSPFVTVETIKREINAVMSGEHDSAFCAKRIQDFIWRDGVPLNFDPENIPRSQELPVLWRETSGVYVFKKEVFGVWRRRVGRSPYIAEVSRKEAIDINTAEDFLYAEMLLQHGEVK